MSLLLGILLTLVIFSIIVFVHEMGHFLTARLTRMRVEEFGMGLPPKAKKLFTDKHGTQWTLNWLPLGGFVRIHGEDDFAGRDPDSLASKSWGARSLVLLAGVMMNFLFAYLIFFVLFLTGTTPLAPNMLVPTRVESFYLPTIESALDSGYITQSGGLMISALTGSIAEQAGVGRDERVESILGEGLTGNSSGSRLIPHTYHDFARIIQSSPTVTLELIASGSTESRLISITPQSGKIGVSVWQEGLELHREKNYSYPLGESAFLAGREVLSMTVMTWDGLVMMIEKLVSPQTPTDRAEATAMVAGPLGIGTVFVQAVEYEMPLIHIFVIMALISLSLGFFNLLPLPALDGGRWVTTTIHSIVSTFFPSALSRLARIEQVYHMLGFILLMGLSIVIAGVDISRWF